MPDPANDPVAERGAGVDLANADLANADLANADLANADLANADLANADLANADHADADHAAYHTAYCDALDRALFDTNPDLVWELERDGTIRRANARLTTLLGYTPDEIRGRRADEFDADHGGGETARAHAAALAGRASVIESARRHRDGHRVAMRTTVIPVVVGGAVVSVLGVSQDVTTAQAKAQRWQEGEALYRLIVDESPECISIWQDGTFLFVNPAGARLMLGADGVPEAVAGRTWADVLPADEVPAVLAVAQEVLAGPEGTSRPCEHRFAHADGRVVECEGVFTHVRVRGRPALHGFSRDVSARRRADGERLRAQRLEALGRLAAGVAHDFNNLLTVMLIAVENAASLVPGDAEAHADLADAADAARRGRVLTRQLLTFARRQESAPATFAPNDVVRGMADLLRRLAGPDVRLALALAPDAGAVTADPAQFEQAVLNLVANARDALPGGGDVVVETARVDGDLRLTVRDTGPGIPADVRPHLFEPFFTTRREGNGLGLATVYGVVTGAGGRVEVESAPGAGAAFHLYFPRAEPGSPTVPRPGG